MSLVEIVLFYDVIMTNTVHALLMKHFNKKFDFCKLYKFKD